MIGSTTGFIDRLQLTTEKTHIVNNFNISVYSVLLMAMYCSPAVSVGSIPQQLWKLPLKVGPTQLDSMGFINPRMTLCHINRLIKYKQLSFTFKISWIYRSIPKCYVYALESQSLPVNIK